MSDHYYDPEDRPQREREVEYDPDLARDLAKEREHDLMDEYEREQLQYHRGNPAPNLKPWRDTYMDETYGMGI